MGMKLGLDNCQILLSRLGNPHLDFPSIHVAGSNGKGSLCVQLSSAATASGFTTGLFTSPHLVTVEERIRIDGRPISSDDFDRALSRVREASEMEPECSPTYFESTFLSAMLVFSEAGVQRGIIETGMGGRLDATRLVDADLCFLTSVSMEHSQFLGETLREIAFEKASIHRPGVPIIVLEHQDSGVREVMKESRALISLGGPFRPRVHGRAMHLWSRKQQKFSTGRLVLQIASGQDALRALAVIGLRALPPDSALLTMLRVSPQTSLKSTNRAYYCSE
ncbi:MAG: hypothetical protein CM1200mP21_06640 [Candidatus Poseidoniales archaeon]|nr:MAG: hypothetical protein CM1200mP21_06640 [Candidatus Poseidoniales archaeon]